MGEDVPPPPPGPPGSPGAGDGATAHDTGHDTGRDSASSAHDLPPAVHTPHRATERTMAAAAAAAAATAAMAALPPVTAPLPVTGRRARRAAGNPYAPGGPEAAVTGPLPAASRLAPAEPQTGLRRPRPARRQPLPAEPPAHREPAPADPPAHRESVPADPPAHREPLPVEPPARRDSVPTEPPVGRAAPAPWAEPVTPEEPATPRNGAELLLDLPPRPAGDTTGPVLRPPGAPVAPAARTAPASRRARARRGPAAPARAPRRAVLVAAAVAVVALGAGAVVAVDGWPFGDDPDSGVSLTANPTTPQATPAPTPSSRQSALPALTTPIRPKLGVFRGTSRSDVRAFERWSGVEVDYVMDYSARDTWQEIADPQYMLDEWRGSGYRPVYAVALLPGTGSATLEAGARGEYDRYFRQLARNLVRADQADAILRIGWEFNVSISRWRADDAAVFKAYWRRVVEAMRSVDGQRFQFDWNVNASNTQVDAAQYWPGDDVVDYVGVDVYDVGWEQGTYPYPDPCDAACRLSHQRVAWDEILGGERGLAFWSDFAKAHGKPMSLPEWGLWRREDGHGGGDNPYFIARMHAFMTDPANNVAYQGYFDANVPVTSDVHRLRTLSQAGATFRRLFR